MPDIQDAICQDLTCLGCGYNLRGLQVDGRCPECGEWILRSLQPSTARPWGAAILIVWLGMLLGILLSNADRVLSYWCCNPSRAKLAITSAKAATVADATNLYLLDTGLPGPIADFDLAVLMKKPVDGGGPSGPYLERPEDLLDPWDNPYALVVPGRVNTSFDIVSYGADGRPGGTGENADITQ
ncbi:MAG: type II secretion system protein GspG [Planctomycetota bacterium]|jgi:general secretion pathway protein G